MVQPLFVNYNEDFIKRIHDEAGDDALIANSYVRGLLWIKDPAVALSAIYVNPNDPSYSAIKFLTMVSLQRPATPTFLIDEEGELTPENISCLIDKFKIKGAIKGKKSFQELLAPLQTELPANFDVFEQRHVIQSKHPGYIPIPVVDFLHSKKYPFSVFVEDTNGGLKFFAMEGTQIDLDYLKYLSERTRSLYVEESSIHSLRESFRLVESAYLDPDYLSPSWRTAEALYRTKTLLETIKKEALSRETVTKTYSIVEDLFVLVSQLGQKHHLGKFIDQAKQCDRTVECMTYSILMCKKLKFETMAVKQLLGLASFFQDISLYHSPFGNLSDARPYELSPEAYEYFLRHPDLSAEMVSSVDHISELSQQIIRQHHERTDRTGFPHRVGGAQLQPLAEILSLINCYIDHRDSKNLEREVFCHYSDRNVNAFKELLATFGSAR